MSVKKSAFIILRVSQEMKDKLLKKAGGKRISAFVREILAKYLG